MKNDYDFIKPKKKKEENNQNGRPKIAEKHRNGNFVFLLNANKHSLRKTRAHISIIIKIFYIYDSSHY